MVVLAALAVAGCGGSGSGGGNPTSPGGAQPPPPGGPPPNPGSHMVTGSVVSALDDAAGAANVAFTAGGMLVGRGDAGGAFAVGFHTSGTNRTTLTAAGFVTRETGIEAPGGNLRLSLIPAAPAFDLTSFNQMFRHQQLSGAGPGLTRWTVPPALVLERRVVQFTGVCATSYAALDETIGDSDAGEILTDMRDGYELLTAGRLGPLASVTTQHTAAGADVAPRQAGRIVVMRAVGLYDKEKYWGYACWSTTADGVVTGGFITLDNDFERNPSPYHRSLRMHELGHTLGCQHVDVARQSVMNSNARHEPQLFDLQSARLAMLRPPGNRAPDVDPPTHIATTAARTMQPVTWHGAH